MPFLSFSLRSGRAVVVLGAAGLGLAAACSAGACSSSSGEAPALAPVPSAEAGAPVDAAADGTTPPDAAPVPEAGAPSEVIIQVPVGTFAIDTREITVAQYMQFRSKAGAAPNAITGCAWKTSYGPPASGCVPPAGADPAQPMTCIDWCDAQAYCDSLGKRLCGAIGGGSATTDAQRLHPLLDEWSNACAGSIDIERWPYGTTADPSRCNTAERDAGTTVAVGSSPGCTGHPPELFDMSGNVAEWEDSCVVGDGGAPDPADPCVARGGSFTDTAAMAKCSRLTPVARGATLPTVGARCCKDLQR